MRKLECVRAITQLALEGRTQPEIAALVGCGQRSVSRYLAQFRADCLQKAEENNSELVALALARYNDVYREAMTKWREKFDPTLLEKALKAQQAICELKGLNAPKQTELTANLEALSVHEEIVTLRLRPVTSDPSELLGQPGEVAGLCGRPGEREELDRGV